MSNLFADVSFPIQGHGETARISDRLPMRLFSLSGCVVGPSWGHGGRDDMASPFWRIYQNFDEGARIISASGVFSIRAGSIVVVPAWLSWRAQTHKEVRHGNALLDLPSIGRERARSSFPNPMELCGPENPLALEGVELFRILAKNTPVDEATEARGLAWIWTAVSRILSRPSARGDVLLASQVDFRFQTLLHWAETRLGEKLDRRRLAEAAALSEAELARRFQENLGTSPARWVRERRIAFAAMLLRQTDESLDAIAERTGLGDRAHFSKVFAKWCGTGPATWRKNQGAGG